MFNGTNGVFSTSLQIQWNQWRTNTWFSYSIVLASNIGYSVTVHQAKLTWATIQGSITPSGANDQENFDTTAPAF